MHLDLVEVGFIRKAQGFKGAMVLHLEVQFLGAIDKIDFLFVDLEGCKVPFRIESVGAHKDVHIKFTQLDTLDEIRMLLGRPIYMEKENVGEAEVAPRDNQTALSHLTGYTVCDQTGQHCGQIMRVEQYPGQIMAIVSHQGEEKLLPLVEQWILALDEKALVLKMQLPGGLLREN